MFCGLSTMWTALAVLVAATYPLAFAWVTTRALTFNLAVIVLSVSITTTVDDFKACYRNLGAVLANFLACYFIMPLVAFCLAKAIGANSAILAGLVLVGAINGGQSSNLFTHIAGGDVALSVLMTTFTTTACIVVTPAIAKVALGTLVPVDAWGIVLSTFEVVLLPVIVGVGLNTLAPRACANAGAFTPVLGVVAGALNVGASVALCLEPIRRAGLSLQFACIALHVIGGVLGYFLAAGLRYSEQVCRTVAIETAMKSSMFGYLLAALHFGAFEARVPAAVSVVWMNLLGAALAAFWRGRPVA